jgi:hypothetical protein
MSDLAHPLALNAIERVRHREPAHLRDPLALAWTQGSSFRAEQIIGHHFVAALATFDDLIGNFSNLILDCPGEPGLLSPRQVSPDRLDFIA